MNNLLHIFIGLKVAYRSDYIKHESMYRNRTKAYLSGNTMWASRANYQLVIL